MHNTTLERPVYLPVPSYPGYRVGDDGSVWSRKGPRPNKEYDWKRVGSPNGHRGDLRVTLSHLGKPKPVFVSRLVLELFVGPCPDGCEACHNNGDFTDNRLSNLRWDTRQANMDDRERHGRTVRGSRSNLAKLTEEQVRIIAQRRAAGERNSDIARDLQLHNSVISRVTRGKTWKHVGVPDGLGYQWHLASRAEAEQIRKLASEGVPQRHLALRFNIHRATVRRIVQGRGFRCRDDE